MYEPRDSCLYAPPKRYLVSWLESENYERRSEFTYLGPALQFARRILGTVYERVDVTKTTNADGIPQWDWRDVEVDS